MEDWSSRAAEKLDRERQTDQQKEERAAQKRRVKEEQGPGLWVRVRQGLQAQIKNLNGREGREVLVAPETSPNKLTIFARLDSGQREMTATFGNDFSIEYQAKATAEQFTDNMGKFTMYVTGDSGLILRNTGGTERSVDNTVEQMLDALMGWK
jgi:hypothetical protein